MQKMFFISHVVINSEYYFISSSILEKINTLNNIFYSQFFLIPLYSTNNTIINFSYRGIVYSSYDQCIALRDKWYDYKKVANVNIISETVRLTLYCYGNANGRVFSKRLHAYLMCRHLSLQLKGYILSEKKIPGLFDQTIWFYEPLMKMKLQACDGHKNSK